MGAQAELMISPVENSPSETGLSLMDGASGCAGVSDHLWRSSSPSVAMYRIPMFLGIEHCSHYLCIFLFFENLITCESKPQFWVETSQALLLLFLSVQRKNVRFIRTRRPKQTNKTGDSLHWTKAPVLFRSPLPHGFFIWHQQSRASN